MLKMKSKREPGSSKRNKSVGKKSKKRSHQRADATTVKSRVKGKKYRTQTQTSDSSKPCESSATNDVQSSMTAYEYYVQCRANSEELRNKRINRKMRGPISKKRMRALHALKTQTTHGTNETISSVVVGQLTDGVDSLSH